MSESTNVAFDGLNSKPQERRVKKGERKNHSGENWGGRGKRREGEVSSYL